MKGPTLSAQLASMAEMVADLEHRLSKAEAELAAANRLAAKAVAKRAREPAKAPKAATPTTVIGADEAAQLLGIHRTTLYEAAGRGEIPCRRIGRRFVFVRETLVAWLTSGGDAP
jgi:excisionase family DNA binding protein